jgi:hypothetical protein
MVSWPLAAGCTGSASTVAGSGHGGVTAISTPCASARDKIGNAEVELASDPARGLVYAEWIGCRQIGFARSADRGKTWTREVALPFSAPLSVRLSSWDPTIAVGPSGTVYAAFMVRDHTSYYPVVDISTDHGATFRVSKIPAPRRGDLGDRPFIAVGPRGQIYVTWDYAPNSGEVRVHCFAGGSCAYTAGDLNAVISTSTDGGRTWSGPVPVAPGFPDSGSISAPIVVTPSGRVDVLFERYQVLSHATLAIGTGHDYFTSSGDGGRSWSAPVRLGPAGDTLSPDTWWIDGSLGADSAGDLYATWDTQSGGTDVGWLSYSVTGGRSWSAPIAVTSGSGEAVNIVQVLGGGPGRAYVGLLTDSGGSYVQYLRAFSVRGGWSGAPVQVSRLPGLTTRWAGDTIGLALAGGAPGHQRVAVSWGSTVAGGGGLSAIWTAVVGRLP